MADDQILPSTSEPEINEEDQEEEEYHEHEQNSASVSNNGNRDRNRDEDEIERRIEMLEEDQESIQSRMSFRERTSRRLSRSVLILSLNLEFIAGIYAYLRIRPRNLGWKARLIRVLPLFLIPALATLFSSFLCRFTIILNLRDRKTLEKVRKERLAKIQELAQSQFQNYYGESSSIASTSRSNLPEASTSIYHTDFDAHEHFEKREKSKKKPKCLVICSNCRMHNGFASKEALQFVSYTCSHCKAFNGHDNTTNSSSAIQSPQSIPYNSPYNENETALPRGIFIEELTPSQETTDPEMDPPVMIIRESPSVTGNTELLNMEFPVVVNEMPRGLLIEEITQNREINEPELDSPVIFKEGLSGSDEMLRGLMIQEITENREINEHELDPPLIFQESSPSVTGEGPVIEELTPNQEIMNREMEPPVMFVQVSPSVTGEEELSREIENEISQMDPQVSTVSDDVKIMNDDVTSVTVQELPLETRELSRSMENVTIVTYPDTDADVTPVTLNRVTLHDSLTESNEIVTETHGNNSQSDSEGESTNGWRSVSSGQFGENEIRVTEVQGNINEDELVRESRENERAEMSVTYPDTDFEANYSESDSDYGSLIDDDGREIKQDILTQSQNQLNENVFNFEDEYGNNAGANLDENEESSVRIREEEQEQNDIFMSVYNDNGDNDNDDSDSNDSLSVSGEKINSVGDEINWTGWQQAEQTENPLRVSEMPQTQEHEDPIRVSEMPETQEHDDPIRVLEMPQTQEERENQIRVSELAQTQEHEIPIRVSELAQTEENENPIRVSEMPQKEEYEDPIRVSEMAKIQEHENPTRVLEMDQTQEHEDPIRVSEMPETQEHEDPIRVSEVSPMEEPQLDLRSESNLDEGKNSVGSLAFKSETDPRKGIGGNLIEDDVKEKKGSQVESENIELGEVSDKEGSIKKHATEESEADPVVKATAALLSTTDPKSKPFSTISTTSSSKWGRSNDFEPVKFDGLRHRRSYTPPLIIEPPVEQGNGGTEDPPVEIDRTEGPVIGF